MACGEAGSELYFSVPGAEVEEDCCLVKRLPERRKPTKPRRSKGQTRKNGKLAKVTFYVRRDQVVDIEAIQLEQRQRTGTRPDKSALIQEALDLLKQKYRHA